MEESKQCLGCRWHGDIYCWHPVFDDQDDLVVSHRRGCRFFEPGKLGVVPAWCPGKEEAKGFKIK